MGAIPANNGGPESRIRLCCEKLMFTAVAKRLERRQEQDVDDAEVLLSTLLEQEAEDS